MKRITLSAGTFTWLEQLTLALAVALLVFGTWVNCHGA